MSTGFGNDFVTISDDDGNEFVLEHLDTIEIDDTYYMALLPTDIEEDDDDFGLVILKVIEENGEDVLISVDDEDFQQSLYERFLERLSDEEADEDNEQ